MTVSSYSVVVVVEHREGAFVEAVHVQVSHQLSPPIRLIVALNDGRGLIEDLLIGMR